MRGKDALAIVNLGARISNISQPTWVIFKLHHTAIMVEWSHSLKKCIMSVSFPSIYFPDLQQHKKGIYLPT